MSQKKDIKRQKARLDALKKEAEAERERAKAEARARVLEEFEKGQLGLGMGGVAVASTSGAKEEDGNEVVENKSNDDAGRMSDSLFIISHC